MRQIWSLERNPGHMIHWPLSTPQNATPLSSLPCHNDAPWATRVLTAQVVALPRGPVVLAGLRLIETTQAELRPDPNGAVTSLRLITRNLGRQTHTFDGPHVAGPRTLAVRRRIQLSCSVRIMGAECAEVRSDNLIPGPRRPAAGPPM